jgi:hypothetical protein
MIAGVIDDNYERIRSDLVRLGLTYDRLMDDVAGPCLLHGGGVHGGGTGF